MIAKRRKARGDTRRQKNLMRKKTPPEKVCSGIISFTTKNLLRLQANLIKSMEQIAWPFPVLRGGRMSGFSRGHVRLPLPTVGTELMSEQAVNVVDLASYRASHPPRVALTSPLADELISAGHFFTIPLLLPMMIGWVLFWMPAVAAAYRIADR